MKGSTPVRLLNPSLFILTSRSPAPQPTSRILDSISRFTFVNHSKYSGGRYIVTSILPNRLFLYRQASVLFFLRLWKYNFDLAVDLRAGSRGAILALLTGARQRVGFFQKGHPFWRNWLFTHLAAPYVKPDNHMTEYYSNLLAEYQITPSDIWPVIVVSEQKQEIAGKLFNEENVPQDRPIIAIQPFCLWQYKEWGAEKYIQLIQQIRTAYNLPVIITGSPEERVRADRITESCENHVYNLAGKTPLGLLPAVLKACRLFVGSDSAGMHIAAGVGTPTVTIYGPSSVSDWAPRGSKHSIVHTEIPCLPCHQKGCDGSGTSRCLEELTVGDVFAAVRGQIDR